MAMSEVTVPIFSDESQVESILADANALDPESETPDGLDDVAPLEDDFEEYVDEEPVEISGGASRGTVSKPTPKRFFNVVDVIGAPMPSENARYSGSSPSVAAKKAARKVWDKSGKKKFTLIMRKVSQQLAGRTLYKYEMTMKKLEDPIGFFTAVVPNFKPTSGPVQKDASKRVKIVRTSKEPIFGYIDDTGQVVEADKNVPGKMMLHRAAINNTLVLNIGAGPMPKTVGTLSVDRTDWHAEFERKQPTPPESEKYDVAGAHKQSSKDKAARTKAKLREKKRSATGVKASKRV